MEAVETVEIRKLQYLGHIVRNEEGFQLLQSTLQSTLMENGVLEGDKFHG